MKRQIKGRRSFFGKNEGVFLIAEAGCNFEGDLDRGTEMVEMAARNGADAIKFQTFIPEKLVTRDAPKFWDIEGCPGETQYDEFQQTPRLAFDDYIELSAVAEECGIILFSTPSDESSADLLERVGVPMHKISSMDITHIPLIRHVAGTGKPLIISTGASTLDEIREAVSIAEAEGNTDIALLHCITNYPTKIRNVNMAMLTEIRKVFSRYPVGYSDHTKMPDSIPVICAAVAMGATVIEKHFTFDRKRPGYDHAISMDYRDLKAISHAIRTVRKCMGSSGKRVVKSENKSRTWARRSLVALTFIAEGTIITSEMIGIKRPGTGIEPKYLERVVGSSARCDIPEDSVITWDAILNR